MSSYSQQDLQVLRSSVMRLDIQPQPHFVAYTYANKDSKTGLFNNQRLLLINSRDRSLGYLSNLPKKLPFNTEDEVPKPKMTLIRGEMKAFKCYQDKSKVSTVKIQWTNQTETDVWMFTFATSDIAKKWNELINVHVSPHGKGLNEDDKKPNPLTDKPAETPPPKQTNNEIPNNNTPINQISPQSNNNQPINNQPKENLSAILASPNNSYQHANTPTNMPIYTPTNTPINMPINTPTNTTQPTHNYTMAPIVPKQTNPTLQSNMNRISTKIAQPIHTPINRTPLGAINDPFYPEAKQINYSNTGAQRDSMNNLQAGNRRNSPRQAPLDSYYNSDAISPKLNYYPEEEDGRTNQPDAGNSRDSKGNINPTNSQLYHNNHNIYDNTSPNNATQAQQWHPKSIQPTQSRLTNIPSKIVPIQDDIPNQYSLDPRNRAPDVGLTNLPSKNIPNNLRGQTTLAPNLIRHQKINSPPFQTKRPINNYPWNELFFEAKTTFETHQKFYAFCQELIGRLCEQLYLGTQIGPSLQQGFNEVEGLHVWIHGYRGSRNVRTTHLNNKSRSQLASRSQLGNSSLRSIQKAPPTSQLNKGGYYQSPESGAVTLYDQESYVDHRRQFYNYNLILNGLTPQSLIKVPLSAWVEHRGVLAYIKAPVPAHFVEIDPKKYDQQLAAIQEAIKLRFIQGTFNVFANPNGRHIVIDSLIDLIPIIPNNCPTPSYFRSEFLLQSQQFIEDLEATSTAHKLLAEGISMQFLQRLELMEVMICSSKDLTSAMHEMGLNKSYLSMLYQKTTSVHFRRIFITELVADVFANIVRSELYNLRCQLPNESRVALSASEIGQIALDCVHLLVEELLRYSQRSEDLWRAVSQQLNRQYEIVFNKEEILVGYLLSAVVEKLGVQIDANHPQFDRGLQFLVADIALPRDMFITFKPKVRCYDIKVISPVMDRMIKLLQDQEYSAQSFDQINRTLSLQTQPLPLGLSRDLVVNYVANYVSHRQEQQYPALKLYDGAGVQPHTASSIKLALQLIKWLVKQKEVEQALPVFEQVADSNTFWLTEFNPPITEFYDFFSMYYASIGHYEQSIKLAKASLLNISRTLGSNALPAADKHYQLGNVYFKLGKKEQALKEYSRTKDILKSHEQLSIPEYGVIMVKLSLLNLNFGKISDCIACAIDALRIFETNDNSHKDELEALQVLARAYEITHQSSDLNAIAVLCAQKFNMTEDPRIFDRMLRICMVSKLGSLGSQQSKVLAGTIMKLERMSLNNPSTAFKYLHKVATHSNVVKRFVAYIDDVVVLSDEISRNELLRKHKALQDAPGDAANLLVLLDAVCSVVGFGFMLGLLMDGSGD